VAKLNKKQILLNLITPPKSTKGAFWTREYKVLKKLMAEYPDENFWQKVKFNMNWDSVCILQTDYGRSLLDKKYKDYKFVIPECKKITLTKKYGDDKIIALKAKTTRQFLDE
jgi:hypothetical protein